MSQEQTEIPNRPDQTAFLARWYDWHRGYRVIRHPHGSEERQALVGEPFSEVDIGHLPRSIQDLRAGLGRSSDETALNEQQRIDTAAQRQQELALATQGQDLIPEEDRLFDDEPASQLPSQQTPTQLREAQDVEDSTASQQAGFEAYLSAHLQSLLLYYNLRHLPDAEQVRCLEAISRDPGWDAQLQAASRHLQRAFFEQQDLVWQDLGPHIAAAANSQMDQSRQSHQRTRLGSGQEEPPPSSLRPRNGQMAAEDQPGSSTQRSQQLPDLQNLQATGLPSVLRTRCDCAHSVLACQPCRDQLDAEPRQRVEQALLQAEQVLTGAQWPPDLRTTETRDMSISFQSTLQIRKRIHDLRESLERRQRSSERQLASYIQAIPPVSGSSTRASPPVRRQTTSPAARQSQNRTVRPPLGLTRGFVYTMDMESIGQHIRVYNSNLEMLRSVQRQRAPLGTREDVEDPNYESPISNMFSNYRTQHLQRQAERTAREHRIDSITNQLRRAHPGSTWNNDTASTTPTQAPSNPALIPGLTVASAPDWATQGDGAADSRAVARSLAWSSDQGLHLRPRTTPRGPYDGPRTIRIPPPRPGPSLDRPERPEPVPDEDMMMKMECKICFSQIATIALLPCGHCAMCEWCQREAVRSHTSDHTQPANRDQQCPVCRKRVTKMVRF